jgi:hypothetical protein
MNQKPISLDTDKIQKLQEIVPGDFDFVLILRANGAVDVCIRDDNEVVLKKPDGQFDVYGCHSRGRPRENVGQDDPMVQSKTSNRVVRAATPMAWVAFQNCGCMQLGGTTIYC